jgi:hypothetical protein
VLKITVMQLADKYVLKIEHALIEQIYKIREADEVRGFNDIAKLVDEQFLKECIARFKEMNDSLYGSFQRNLDWNP